MIVSFYDILSNDGKIKEYECSVSELRQTFQGEPLIISGKAPFILTIGQVSKDIINIEGCVGLNVIRVCARCLDDVECEYELSINKRINTAKHIVYELNYNDSGADNIDSDDNDSEAYEISYIEDCTLDVDRLIMDELYTILPMSVICKDDCRGICKVCGTNLNKSSCDCDQTVPDPRMAVFSDIFKQFTVSDDTDE